MNFASSTGDTVRVPWDLLPWLLRHLPAVLPQIRYLENAPDYTIRRAEVGVWATALLKAISLREAELDAAGAVPRRPLTVSTAPQDEWKGRERTRALEADELYRALWQVAELFQHADANDGDVEFADYP